MAKNPERALAGAIGHQIAYARHGGEAMTEPMRRNGPGQLAYWLVRVDPDLPEAERIKRAEALKKAFYLKLAHASLVARAKKRKAGAS